MKKYSFFYRSYKKRNTEEQLLVGFIGLLAVVGIVVLIVLLVKKNRPGPATVPACNVSGGNGVCTSGINTQGKRNCVGGDQLCGVNLAPHQKAHPEDKNCSDILTKYGQNMIKCNDGYQASVAEDQGNCVFKCIQKENFEGDAGPTPCGAVTG